MTRALLGALAASLAIMPAWAGAADRVISAVPRSSTVDAPLQMFAGVPPLSPLSLKAAAGAKSYTIERRGRFNGKDVRYDAVLAQMQITGPDGAVLGDMWSTSYLAKGAGPTKQRPVLFLFNGGPGAASAPLHLLSLGPKRLVSTKASDYASPDNPARDNPSAPLDAMDLVFIDPVGTGFSQATPEGMRPLRSVDGDAEAVAQFIRTWLDLHGRSESPKFILGESYGTLRAIAVTRDLARGERPVVLDGIVLAGFASTFAQNGRTPSPLFVASELPMMASLAWRHGKIDRVQSWDQAVDKARVFARTQYLPALAEGYGLSAAEFDRIVTQLPSLIGIPDAYFRERHTLAVEDFNTQLLKDQALVLDRNNGAETHPATQAVAPRPPRPFAALELAMERYASNEFGARDLPPYRLIATGDTDDRQWNFVTGGDPALDVTLAKLMKAHAAMRLLVLQGRFDTLTDLGSTEYVMAQTDVPRDRYVYALFDGGHVLELTPESDSALRAFVTPSR